MIRLFLRLIAVVAPPVDPDTVILNDDEDTVMLNDAEDTMLTMG